MAIDDALAKLFGIEIKYNFDKSNLSFHIENSFKVRNRESITRALKYIHKTDEYKKLERLGFSRTMQSQINEWIGHNVLYEHGFMQERTKSVDINQNETTIRRIGYTLLSIFYK